MLNGLYSGAKSLVNLGRQQELVSANLAHLNTPGHKKMVFLFQESERSTGDQNPPASGSNREILAFDFSQGRNEATGRKLDLALSGDAFFTFQGGAGDVYTRNGVLFRDQTGQLVNEAGLPILGDGGPIVVPPEIPTSQIVVDSQGNISAGEAQFGTLSLVTFDDNALLESRSQTHFLTGQATPQEIDPTSVFVRQGHRELSNATPVGELISLIVGSRNFEASQKVIRTLSETLQESIRA